MRQSAAPWADWGCEVVGLGDGEQLTDLRELLDDDAVRLKVKTSGARERPDWKL